MAVGSARRTILLLAAIFGLAGLLSAASPATAVEAFDVRLQAHGFVEMQIRGMSSKYGIHGDELSSSDAAVTVAYRLVAGTDDLSQKLRQELLILIDPMENPDGRDRFLAQTSSLAHKVPNPDTDDLSHTTVWPWGRGNHYLFDLNRDWFSMVQP